MEEPWPASYRNPVPIRCRGGLHFYSFLDSATDRLHVVVMAPFLPLGEARRRLSGLAHVHRLVAGPHVPGVAAESLDGPTPWVALDCDAIADFDILIDFVAQGGEPPHFELSSTLGKTLMETLGRIHQVRDPDTGRSICLGSLSADNLLFSGDGAMWLIGFGAGPVGDAVIAPEVAAGAPPTPGADVYALTIFLRSQIRFTRMPPVLSRVFMGDSIGSDVELLVLLAWSNLRILAGSPQKRPTMAMALAQAQRMWRRLGFEPDVEGFRAWVARAIAVEPRRLPDAPPRRPVAVVVLGRSGEWLETPNGMRHSLVRRRPLRRLLLALADAHKTRPGAPLGVAELLEAGWPGERPLAEAGQNRVWVAISTLRKLGLSEALQRVDGGYRLDPNVPCILESAPHAGADFL